MWRPTVKTKRGKTTRVLRPQTPHDGNVLAISTVSRFAVTTEAVQTSLKKRACDVTPSASLKCAAECHPGTTPKKAEGSLPDFRLHNNIQALFAQFPLYIFVCVTMHSSCLHRQVSAFSRNTMHIMPSPK